VRTKPLRGALIFVDGFAAVSALFGGLELETGWPFRFPTSMLHGTPFSDYVVPGLVLGILVGGSATIATAATILTRSAGAYWSFIAGGIMAGWIVGEVFLLDVIASTDQGGSQGLWLQAFYFMIGVVMMLLALPLAPDRWWHLERVWHARQGAISALRLDAVVSLPPAPLEKKNER
jgi:hypothetical protein